MFAIKAYIETINIGKQCFMVETKEALVTLLQMLQNNERCSSFTVFDTVTFEEITDLKARFNISNQSFTKFKS